MNNDEMVLPSVQKTTLVLSAAAALTAQVFRRVAGNDISTAMNGETLTTEMLSTMAMSTMRRAAATV